MPFHRSPCSRAGGSAGPASSGSRSQTRSTSAASPGRTTPASTARRRYGSTRCSAYQRGQSLPATLRIGARPMNASSGPPGGAAPNAGAPAECSAARSRPNRTAARALAGPSGTRSVTSRRPSSPTTAGTRTAPAPASQRSPADSARAAPAPSQRLTITVRPSARKTSVREADHRRSPVTVRPVNRAAAAEGVIVGHTVTSLGPDCGRPGERRPVRRWNTPYAGEQWDHDQFSVPSHHHPARPRVRTGRTAP
ncbi:exported protein of unknown function [Streptomyces ambofaciens ATCC 23877]|uniref:Uncharacterized protein n=1 Tax=Streptomyces ambofaciens (strain ATCC 23877 / 3486 / DSM 40053 / JCM 4204 / NBRC 12836 / NRRL B-2516) TaxID=278992 RepID=A0A0K2ALV0_STRA7|nr:exported protein of unknown function [Streptomyces ambofaciens ATCC 23877]